MYAGLVLLGIHDRSTPGLVAMVSAWSALLSSFEEVRRVLCDHGISLGVKVIRKLTYRYAERARAMQQAGQIPLNEKDTLQGRRVIISTDGGRTRLREKKHGGTWLPTGKGFFLPVKALAALYRGKFKALMKEAGPLHLSARMSGATALMSISSPQELASNASNT